MIKVGAVTTGHNKVDGLEWHLAHNANEGLYAGWLDETE